MKRLVGTLAACVVLVAFVMPAAATEDRAPLEGEGEGLEIVANVEYSGGTDFEFISHKNKEYAITGSVGDVGGLRVIDITEPEKPFVAAYLPCKMSQADIQISHDGKTAIMAADSAGGPESCEMLGVSGFMTVDISNPTKPKPIGHAAIPRGSHNTTAHPKKPYVYNSDSDLAALGEIQIWSIKNPAKPKLLNTVRSLPHSPHDIAFNKKGTLAVTAAVSHVDLWNTEDPVNPILLMEIQCPGCTITHDAKFTPDGRYLVVGDEAGGGMAFPCPGGALYFYEILGSEAAPAPVLTGIYEPDEFVVARDDQAGPGSCTSHVFDISDDSSYLAVSWYTAGTRLLRIDSPVGLAVGSSGTGALELGWFMPEGGTSWASKFHKGPYIYSSDLGRGFDVFKIVD